MLFVACWIAMFDVTVSVVLAWNAETYTKCVQLGTTSVSKTPFLNLECMSVADCADMCTSFADCTVFTYDDCPSGIFCPSLTKLCHLYQMTDTLNCELNDKNGGMILTKEADCPVDWKRFGNSCYYYENTTKLSWDDAKAYCISQGGYLAEVTDETELQLVDSMINDDVFLGCRHDSGKWQWATSGQRLMENDTMWAPEEPKGVGCVQIWAGQLDDNSCIGMKKFVCEKAILFV